MQEIFKKSVDITIMQSFLRLRNKSPIEQKFTAMYQKPFQC